MDSRLPVVHQRRELFTGQNGDLSFGRQDFGTSGGEVFNVGFLHQKIGKFTF